MGFFSWLSSKSGTSIPAYPYAGRPIEESEVVLVLPDNSTIRGVYDGYGCIRSEEGDEFDVYEEVAKYLDDYDHTGRDFVFEPVKWLTSPEGVTTVVDVFSYEEPLPQFDGKTLNSLCKEGYTINTRFDEANKLIKIVKDHEYLGEKWSDLEISENCPAQGYFYCDDEFEEEDYEEES